MNDRSPIRPCAPDLTERVLERFGFSTAPEPDAAGLERLYTAWCERVPFDNVLKRHLFGARGGDGSLPGETPAAFFESWLEHGTGGTCWSSAAAMGSLLAGLGFSVERATATMHPVPNVVNPNHGTIIVDLDGDRRIVDSSILHGAPLPLDGQPAAGALSGAEIREQDGSTHVHWRPLHKPDGILCRIDETGVGGAEFDERHESTRPWSFFNYTLNVRTVREGASIGIAMGSRVQIGPDGVVERTPLDRAGRDTMLAELGMSEEVIDQLPTDDVTPPPPGMPAERWKQVVAALTGA